MHWKTDLKTLCKIQPQIIDLEEKENYLMSNQILGRDQKAKARVEEMIAENSLTNEKDQFTE